MERKKFLAEGSCIIGEKEITYKATTEEFVFFDKANNPEATAYTFSYERTNDTTNNVRPLLFAYNGGPGAASTLLHIGAMAPYRVKMDDAVSMNFTPPFEMENNSASVLDICDIVLIDPIGTGYAKLLKSEAKEKYYNSKGDAAATITIISKWLTAHKRWNSPIFIMGESYGTIRNALVADAIYYHEYSSEGTCNMFHLNGIIMLGTALDHGQTPFPVDTAVLNFTSIVSTYWYHHRDGKPGLQEFIEKAEAFAYREYLPALALGRRLPKNEEKEIAKKLNQFTGIDEKKLVENHLRVETSQYPILGMSGEGEFISRYDGRFTMKKIEDASNYDMFSDDAACIRFMPAFVHCFNGIWKDQLNIEIEEPYEGINIDVSLEWDFKTPQPPIKCLEKAMRKNPGLKLMFGTGYYDMLTTQGYTRYLVNHFDLPKDRVWVKEYESGHMPYLGRENLEQLGADLREFIKWGMEER